MSKISVVLVAGNSDDKLTQLIWSQFCSALKTLAEYHGQIHYAGSTEGHSLWQTYAIIVEVEMTETDNLFGQVTKVRTHYGQDSIAWIAGEVFYA
jgi:hypothetical protein